MRRAALTFIGRDRPGIIAQISGILCGLGCNIEDATMTILEGEFAMILIASLPNPVTVSGLKRQFSVLTRNWGLHVFSKNLGSRLFRGEKHPAGTQSYVISVMGKDTTGIVYETSKILARYRLNVTDLNSKILGGGKKKSIFAMMLEVDIPKCFRISRLTQALETLHSRSGLDIRMKPVERLPL